MTNQQRKHSKVTGLEELGEQPYDRGIGILLFVFTPIIIILILLSMFL